MNVPRIFLKLILEQAGIENIKLDSFSQRFNIQKRIYLTQILGLDLGYRFGWYLRGPYCTDLTNDAYALKEEALDGQTNVKGRHLTETTTERMQKARQLWEVPINLSVDVDRWLELLASIHYLKHIAYWPNWPKEAMKDFDAVFDTLIKAKPHFKDFKADAKLAWQRLDVFGLIQTKTLA